MGRLAFNFAAKAPAQQDAENAASGLDGNSSESIKAAEIYFNEGTNSKIKAMRLLVLALLVTCVFMSAFIALPQLTRLCQIDSNSPGANYKVYCENITRLIESNQECSDKVNSLLQQLQAASDKKEILENILGSESYNPTAILNSETGNNFMPIIEPAADDDENPFGIIPNLEDDESAMNANDNEYK